MHASGAALQFVAHRNVCQDIHPAGGVRERPFGAADAKADKELLRAARTMLMAKMGVKSGVQDVVEHMARRSQLERGPHCHCQCAYLEPCHWQGI
jgi:hypothetical protein